MKLKIIDYYLNKKGKKNKLTHVSITNVGFTKMICYVKKSASYEKSIFLALATSSEVAGGVFAKG